jgi:hypothetical protein
VIASADISLRKAVRARLLATPALVARLGGARVHDEAPRGAPQPYIAFAQSRSRDWSTMTERGQEHALTLDVWSERTGAREALEIAVLASAALDDQALVLEGHTLVNLQEREVEAARENSNRFVRARLRLRAITEPK